MNQMESEATLRRQIRAKIARLGKSGIFMSGTFVRKSRKSGKQEGTAGARCAGRHLACTVTSKVCGKTKAVYVPVSLWDEVEQWVIEHRRVKRLLKEIDELAERIIRLRAPRERAERRRNASLESPDANSSRES